MESELLRQLVELNDKYLETEAENKRLVKLVDTTEKHYLELGIIIGKQKFSSYDFIRGILIGVIVTIIGVAFMVYRH